MLNDYTVNVVYKNKALESVNNKTYPLTDYCQEQKLHLLYAITDVENAFYDLQGNVSKDDWSQTAVDAFQRIRHKLLDAANSIERLPKNLHFKGQNIDSISSSEYVADIINKITSANKAES